MRRNKGCKEPGGGCGALEALLVLVLSGLSHGRVLHDQGGEEEGFLVPPGHGGGRAETGAQDHATVRRRRRLGAALAFSGRHSVRLR